jgi:hypothetical protein
MDLARDDSFAEAQLYALVDVAAAAAGAHRLDDVLELAAIGGASLSIGRWEEGFIVTLINVGDLGAGEQRFPTNKRYPLSQFPTTERVLPRGGMMVSAVDDPASDPAQRELLRSLGKQTSLTVPIIFEGSTCGDGAAARAVSVEAMRRLKVASGVELSISCGISAGGPELTRPVALLRAADSAQYQAKSETAGIPAKPASGDPAGATPSLDGARAFRGGAAARQELAAELLSLVSQGNGSTPQQLRRPAR